jgi:hypothetical protein
MFPDPHAFSPVWRWTAYSDGRGTDQGRDARERGLAIRISNSFAPRRAVHAVLRLFRASPSRPAHVASAWTERGNPSRAVRVSPVRFAGFPAWVCGYDLRMKAAKRKSLRKSDFVYPPGSRIGGSQGRYPIDTKKRACAALRYSARADTAGTYKTVSNKVHKRYPSLSTS